MRKARISTSCRKATLLPRDAMLAHAVYAVVMCLSVFHMHAGIVPKRLNVGSRKQRHTIANGLYFYTKDLGKIPTGHPNGGAE